MDFEQINKVHIEIGMLLYRLSENKLPQDIRKMQDDLSNKLASGSVNNLNDLYEAILEVTK